MRDLISGLRMLRRSPGLAAAAILSIGLGIGATTAIFGVVRHVLLRPLPYSDPGRLAVLWETSPDDPDRWIAPANFLDWQRDTAAVFEAMAAYDSFSAPVSGPGEPERLRVASASGTFFAVLGQPVQEGRTLTADDDRPGAPCVAVLTDALRRRRFGDAPVLGSAIVLDGRPCDVVGVLPAGFTFPCRGPSCGSTAIAACRAASPSRATSPPCAIRTSFTRSAGCATASASRPHRRPCRR